MWHVDWQINLNWPEFIEYILVLIFIKKYNLKYFFKSNYIFISHSSYF
jgi:hypothetical protein